MKKKDEKKKELKKRQKKREIDERNEMKGSYRKKEKYDNHDF